MIQLIRYRCRKWFYLAKELNIRACVCFTSVRHLKWSTVWQVSGAAIYSLVSRTCPGGVFLNPAVNMASYSLGKFDWAVRYVIIFSVRTILNSTGCCKLPRYESSYRSLPGGAIGKEFMWHAKLRLKKPVFSSTFVYITKPWYHFFVI